jgi:ATP-dependent exoDNAse (exonuclease V) alpha subunit
MDKHISYTNRKRIEVNKIMMNKKLDTSKEEFLNHQRKKKVKITPFTDYIKLDMLECDKNSQDVILMKGTPIISKINKLGKKDELQLVNNEEFIIKDIQKELITIENYKGETYDINTSDFQKWFYVAYCITTHASQGCTFDFPYTIHEFNMMSNTMKYVAISRSTKKEYVNISI